MNTSDTAVVSQEEIAERAHTLWEESGRPEGRSEEFWARAESELRTERLQANQVKSGLGGSGHLVGPL